MSVQLGQYIVQKQDGIIPHQLFHQLDLCQLQGKGSRSLLSLGTESPDIDFIQKKSDIIPVRPGESCFLLPVLSTAFFQLRLQLIGRGIGIIHNSEIFLPAGKSPVNFTDHIIQLIEKRGDRINCRHILLKPKVSDKELNEGMTRMDSLYNDLTAKKFTFEEAATFISADKDTRNNKGLMVNQNFESDNHSTPKFEMSELPQEIGKMVYTMQVGDISKPFTMINEKQKEVVAIVKLKARVDQHKANISDDYQALKSIVESRKREELLHDWIIKKQKSTYVRISDGWRNCDFQYPGWIKE